MTTREARITPALAPSVARPLLIGGALSGPTFVVVIAAQALTREGFDPKAHPLSLLALGSAGWIQTVDFIVAGILAVAGAVGLRRAIRPGPAATWGPILIGAHGAGLVWAGVFPTDPAFGFPPGSESTTTTWHGALHAIAPSVSLLALIAACLVFARRYRRDRPWLAYCLATAVAAVAAMIAASATGDFRLLLLSGVLCWLWASAVCVEAWLRRTGPAR